MTKDEALTVALQQIEVAVEYIDHLGGESGMYRAALVGLKKALAQPNTDMAYTIALQRAIEWHCDGKAVPPDVAEVCPYHAEMLNKTLAQQETDWEAVAALVEERTYAKQLELPEPRLTGKFSITAGKFKCTGCTGTWTDREDAKHHSCKDYQ